MRLITSCAACNTQFHVKPEQLAAHAGEVRCGHCQHLFNASARLYEILEPQRLIPLSSEDTDLDDEQAKEVEPVHIDPEEAVIPATESEATFPAELDEEISAEIDTYSEHLATVDIDHGESVDTEIHGFSSLETIEPTADNADIVHDEYEPPEPLLEPIAQASFLTPEKSTSSRRISPWLTASLGLLLLLILLVQTIYYLRTELAGHWPASKPALVSACEWLGCTVPLARNSELLALDDSDLQEDFEHPEVIQLSTKLINNASYTQAYPMLELTLTNDDDQPKLRRIFKPEEYLPSATDIEAGLPANEEIQINLAFSTSGETVSGYRVFVTY